MMGRIALNAATGLVVIGALSANTGNGGDLGAGGSGGEASTSAGSGSGQAPGGDGGSGGAELGATNGVLSGDGDFRVGTDIAPGTYRSTGNAHRTCRWERVRDAKHRLRSVIANGHTAGTAVVTIRATDAYFRSTGCGGWKRTG
ncbi:hypothetical protein E5083_23120 [Streptomyces bauhiniae]|uniref:Uncharacterized protein n=1 Tax=Streptomyces bauhiniae TaxID=2340725 RepID=A0A4Z1CXF0_9ACTN|nr:hypothetical protein [Streptomyces bauhiniae]TGN73698.1 hypothetical protein E5083_23120 [Streptomyces bauhiniae]